MVIVVILIVMVGMLMVMLVLLALRMRTIMPGFTLVLGISTHIGSPLCHRKRPFWAKKICSKGIFSKVPKPTIM